MVKMRRGQHTLAGHMSPRMIEGAQVRRLVRQALERVATQQDTDAVMRVALLNAGEKEIPDDPGKLTTFVLGPLRDGVIEFVGEQAGDTLVRSLKPLLKMKSEIELKIPEEPEEAPDDERSTSSTPPARRPSDLGVSVIVIDSDVGERAKISRVLRKNGYTGVSAPDANVALAMCVRRRPDLLIANLDDAGTTGKKLSALLRVAFGSEAPPLLLLTKADQQVDAQGVAAVVSAPVDDDVLLATLKELTKDLV